MRRQSVSFLETGLHTETKDLFASRTDLMVRGVFRYERADVSSQGRATRVATYHDAALPQLSPLERCCRSSSVSRRSRASFRELGKVIEGRRRAGQALLYLPRRANASIASKGPPFKDRRGQQQLVKAAAHRRGQPASMASSTPPRASTSTLRTPARPPPTNLGPSPAYVGTSRSRHAVYGIDDRIVLDLGSRVWKAGFSGESKPRVVASVKEVCGGEGEELWTLRGVEAMVEEEQDRLEADEVIRKERIQDGLRRIFFHHLMVDPKQRKVIVIEDPLLPNSVKEAIATVLFDNLSVPSVSFSAGSVVTLMAAGTITGLVVDIGHLETSVTPVRSFLPWSC